MITIYSLIAVVSFCGWLYYWHQAREQRRLRRYWEDFSGLQYQQRLKEQRRRLVYERALALPLTDPQRSEELWARAQQGDDLAELILLEQMASDLEGRARIARRGVFDQYSDC